MREWLVQNFYLVYAGVPIFLGFLLLKKFTDSASNSNFRRDPHGRSETHQPFRELDAQLKAREQERARGPALLTGFRTDAPPHEILGVNPNASATEIQRAYKTMMKRYHPDLMGPPGSQPWKDAQAIAEAINRARDVLLKK